MSFPDEAHSTGGSPRTIHEIYWFQLDVRDMERLLFLNRESAAELIRALHGITNRAIRTELDAMHAILKQVFQLIFSEQVLHRQECAALICLFLYRLFSYERGSQFQLTPDITASIEYIHRHLEESILLDELASEAGISLSRFKQKFRQQIGISPREFVNNLKVERSKVLLREGKSITQIAMTLGFNSSNYYASVFKRFTTMTPTEYIRWNAEKNSKGPGFQPGPL